MKQNNIFFSGIVLMISLFALWGCPKKAEVTASPETQNGGTATATQQADSQPAVKEKDGGAEQAPPVKAGLQPVYFDYDKSFIRDNARQAMISNVAWLKANPAVKIKIEGNCDERGTREYNQALGQRRAASAKKFLTDGGIAASRISLISYGKEKPTCSEDNEECWQKNRRDDFVAVNK